LFRLQFCLCPSVDIIDIIVQNIFASFLIVLCGAWTGGFLYLIVSMRRLPRLERESPPAPSVWPRLSVIVPACNEAAHIESALASLVQQDYPNLEIILVNDRSMDGTGKIIDRFASSDARIHAVHVDQLPAGWLGKVHALQCGIQKATGTWLLFTDADVHFTGGTLRRAVAFALNQGCDHLALIPLTLQSGFWLDVVVRTFGLLFFVTTRAGSANRPSSKTFVGIGAFNLVRAQTLCRTQGFEWLRLEPADDVGLALMIKLAGGVSRLAIAYENLTVEWYPTVGAMFKGLEKNLFGPACYYHWWLMLIQVGVLCALAVAPLTALGWGLQQPSLPVLLSGLSAVVAHGIFSLVVDHRGREAVDVLMLPVGLLMIGAMLIRAAYKCIQNGGVDWRGTHYSLAELRAGQRVRF